ncbi:MAG: hypothetical protein AB7S26_00045 [Sandaracinaceae bacterium]
MLRSWVPRVSFGLIALTVGCVSPMGPDGSGGGSGGKADEWSLGMPADEAEEIDVWALADEEAAQSVQLARNEQASFAFDCPLGGCALDMGFGFETFVPDGTDTSDLQWLGVRVDRDSLAPDGSTRRDSTVVPLSGGGGGGLSRLGSFTFDDNTSVRISLEDPWRLLTRGELSGVRVRVTVPLCEGVPCAWR